jgi:hypothetical protein
MCISEEEEEEKKEENEKTSKERKKRRKKEVEKSVSTFAGFWCRPVCVAEIPQNFLFGHAQ